MSLLIIGLAFAISTATVADVTCPPPGMVAPRYPVDRLRSDTAGKTIVLARIDDCGRVVEAKVHEGSGYADLDAAALLAAQSSVLSPVQRAGVPTGWVKLPFAFQGLSRITVSAPDWPRSHRRPVYLIDDQAIGFATIQSLEDAGVAGLHIEDQVNPKRCGHLDGKAVVDTDTALKRIRAAAAARR